MLRVCPMRGAAKHPARAVKSTVHGSRFSPTRQRLNTTAGAAHQDGWFGRVTPAITAARVEIAECPNVLRVNV
jgi:hypothetical protein